MLHSAAAAGGRDVTYYGPKNIADSFRTVRKNSLIIANEIPEEQNALARPLLPTALDCRGTRRLLCRA